MSLNGPSGGGALTFKEVKQQVTALSLPYNIPAFTLISIGVASKLLGNVLGSLSVIPFMTHAETLDAILDTGNAALNGTVIATIHNTTDYLGVTIPNQPSVQADYEHGLTNISFSSSPPTRRTSGNVLPNNFTHTLAPNTPIYEVLWARFDNGGNPAPIVGVATLTALFKMWYISGGF